jgi:hypothetical protein
VLRPHEERSTGPTWAALIEHGIDTNAERRKARRLTAIVHEQGEKYCA